MLHFVLILTVLCRHIADMFHNDQEYALHTLPKLTVDHILLSSFSKSESEIDSFNMLD